MTLILALAATAYLIIAVAFYFAGQLSTPDNGQHWLPPVLAAALWFITIIGVGLYVAYERLTNLPPKEST